VSGPDDYLFALRQAMTLADSVRGRTSPNPPVGAIVLNGEGQIVGAGSTQPVGGPHAERQALDAAGDQARGATTRGDPRAVRAHGSHPSVHRSDHHGGRSARRLFRR